MSLSNILFQMSKKHTLREFSLNNGDRCNLCEKNHSTQECPSLLWIKAMLKNPMRKLNKSASCLRRNHGPIDHPDLHPLILPTFYSHFWLVPSYALATMLSLDDKLRLGPRLKRWWAPEMSNYMGSYFLLFSFNPPFSIVLCMLLNIFMLIEWMGIVTLPQSLIRVYCRFLDIFGPRPGIYE